jgi:hypothetical protein
VTAVGPEWACGPCDPVSGICMQSGCSIPGLWLVTVIGIGLVLGLVTLMIGRRVRRFA